MSEVIARSVKVTSKGQITLPKDIRDALKVTSGDRVTLIYENNQVSMINSLVYAMMKINKAIEGEAKKSRFK